MTRSLPHNLDAEASILGGIILRNEVLLQLESLETADFYDHKHKVVFEAIRNLEAAGRPIDVVTLENEVERVGKLEAIGGVAFLGVLALRVPTVENLLEYAKIVRGHSYARQRALLLAEHADRASRAVDETDELDGDLDRKLADLRCRYADVLGATRQPVALVSARDVDDDIEARVGEPQWPITLGTDELVTTSAGEVVVLVAAAKRGKTSLAVCAALEHARDRGPAIVYSLELAPRLLVARAIGSRTEASWRAVLRGEVPRARRREVLPARLYVVDRDRTLADLGRVIDAAHAAHAGEPILVVIDYVQLVPSDERDVRARVDAAMRAIDALAQSRRVAVLALSQSSRAASRQLANGERTGAEAGDAGAESAAIERWASAVIAIGAMAEPSEDGSCAVELSIAVVRYERGDRVLPARADLRTGRWWIAGDARPAAEVRAERQARGDDERIRAARLAIVAYAGQSAESLTSDDLRGAAATNRDVARAAIAAELECGGLVRVRQKRPRASEWRLWTRERADAAGIPIVTDVEAER